MKKNKNLFIIIGVIAVISAYLYFKKAKKDKEKDPGKSTTKPTETTTKPTETTPGVAIGETTPATTVKPVKSTTVGSPTLTVSPGKVLTTKHLLNSGSIANSNTLLLSQI